MTSPAESLQQALTNQDTLLQWFNKRGYTPNTTITLPTPRKELHGIQPLYAQAFPTAPRFLFQWRDDFSERTIKGKRLRTLQREANDYCTQQRAQPAFANDVPELFVLGCPDFLLFFPLNGDVYARRLRFSHRLLQRQSGSLHQHYHNINAAHMATFATTPAAQDKNDASDASTSNDTHDADDGLDFLDELIQIGEEARVQYDFSALFIGEQLDEDFVALMAMERREMLYILLRPELRKELLIPLLKHLQLQGEDWGKIPLLGDGFPALEQLIQRSHIRHRLIAAVDTVLLRVVLYRYLEAQFGYEAQDAEKQDFAFGVTFDEILEKTTQTHKEALLAAQEQASAYRQAPPNAQAAPTKAAATAGTIADKATKKKGKKAAIEGQLSLFGSLSPVQPHDPKVFVAEVKERNDYYQRQAGGDLHHGMIAEAATFLQEYLLQHHTEGIATLLVVTSSDRYSFAYADLDPRAFQRFYENTIGTDIRILYQPDTGEANVEVVHWHQNRKEQGAYFTNERICKWLVQRSLGKLYDQWLQGFTTFLKDFATLERGKLTGLRAQLNQLMSWKIMDPTMGGGIFLRAAFEYLSEKHETIASLLHTHIPPSTLTQLFEDQRYRLFRKDDTQQGEWQWYILLHMLYGVDVDIKAVNIASNLLTLSALTYKPHGVCFPSFINTNLKRGNAFVIPIDPTQKAAFGKQHKADIKALIALRQELRNPGLSRESWRQKHQEAATITERVTNQQIHACFGDLFGTASTKERLQRTQRTGVFLYEIEFPELFFDHDGNWLDNPGFDVIVGNPPWEAPAKQLKHFLPEFDPTYRELSGPASKAREAELLADTEIASRWEIFQQSIDDFRLLISNGGWYQHQSAVVGGKKHGSQNNLYMYATELAWAYLRQSGFAAILLDGGLWNDLSATGLRRMLLNHTQLQAICGFVNHKGIFADIDNRTKFSCNVFQKGGSTQEIKLVFMREELDDLDHFDTLAFAVNADIIRNNPSETYAIPEISNREQWHAQQTLAAPPRLLDVPWNVEIHTSEFHASAQRHFFLSHQDGYYPLIQGKEFNLFGVHQGALPEYWLDPSMEGAGGFLYERQKGRVLKAIAEWLDGQGKLQGGKAAAALAWIKATTGFDDVPAEWVRLDWEGYRIAWRDITNRTNKRTLLAAILPPGVGVSDKAPTIRPFKLVVTEDGIQISLQYPLEQLLYLSGVLSSFACDSIARSRVAKTNLKKNVFENFNIPPWEGTKAQERVAVLAGMLTCLPATEERPWVDMTELAASVGLEPGRDGLVDTAARNEAEAELNALVAGLYGLDRDAFAFLMNELFMTKQHKEEHTLMRDTILAKM